MIALFLRIQLLHNLKIVVENLALVLRVQPTLVPFFFDFYHLILLIQLRDRSFFNGRLRLLLIFFWAIEFEKFWVWIY